MDRAKLSKRYEDNARAVTARIRWLMTTKGISRERIIALLSGCRSARTVNNWLSPAPPYAPFEELSEIAKALRESTHYIITGSDETDSEANMEGIRQNTAFELEWLRANYLRCANDERRIICELAAKLAHHNGHSDLIW